MKKNKESSWISFTDLMTALMVIFMFIAISYIVEVKKEQDKIAIILEDYENNKTYLYNTLQEEFKDDFQKWEIQLNEDLSIQFTNPDILFASGQKDLQPRFKQNLDEFLPRYFNILLSSQYKDKILEIRIEGHTDTVPAPRYDRDPYIGNTLLSQLRATEVLKYFKNSQYHKNLDSESKKDLRYMLTANGLSYGRMLDNNKELIEISGNLPNNDISRRVEFKIVTKTEEAVEKAIQQLKNRT